MMMKPLYVWVMALSAVLVFLGGIAYESRSPSQEQEAVAFVTVGLNQSMLPGEVSSYEIQRAVEHFSSVILGWLTEPHFAKEFEAATGGAFAFSARGQEKENLLFTVTGPVEDTTPAEKLVDLVEARLSEYNAASHSGYVIAIERETLVPTAHSDWRVPAGLALLVVIVEILVFLSFEHARRR